MDNEKKLYLSTTGMLTAIGDSAEMTAASVKAGISGFEVSEYKNQQDENITMAGVPQSIIDELTLEIDIRGDQSELFNRIIKMAFLTLSQVFKRQALETPVPLILALPETLPSISNINTKTLFTRLIDQSKLPIDPEQIRRVHTGRAAGIHGLDLAERFLYDHGHDYVLVGGSDSYWDTAVISHLNKTDRAKAPGAIDAFIPGEGAGFLLLTRHPEKALVVDDHIIALCPAGVAQESGHIYSDQPYRGDGLSQAVQQALKNYQGEGIHSVYSSMNGEHYWSKEYGVAMTRNHSQFIEDVIHQHHADCYGDLGAATGPVLIGLAAENLRKIKGSATHLVYSSSDSAWRAALRVEKISLAQV